MDKKLPEHTAEKEQSAAENAKAGQVAAGQKAPADFSKTDIGGYANQATYNPALSEKSWRDVALKDSVAGRGVIRMFSRGVMGASAFALGGLYAGKRMKTYGLDKPVENWVQGIARGFDNTFGKGISKTVTLMGKDGDHFVNSFRSSVPFPGYGGKKGRSLGHEVVMVTFDFATMSIGDFWGRKFAHTIDPKAERPAWKREDGTIDWVQATKTFGHNWWTALTYSAGEDWAVAVPYVLTMRHLGTPALNKMIPGYKYDFDLGGNGGGLKVNDQSKVVGNFTTAGVINLWERFTTYNVGTLLFREAYGWLGNEVKYVWKHHKLPKIVEPVPGHNHESIGETAVDGAKQFTNWIARGTVKALMYMIPAVPFFWVTRVPQHKFRGTFIHPEKGALVYYKKDGSLAAVHAATMHNPARPITRFTDLEFTPQTPVFFAETKEQAINPFLHARIIDPNAKTWGFVDAALNPVAKMTDKVREKLRGPVGRIFGIFSGHDEGKKRAGTYIMASMAYTPYFWAKSDWLAAKLDYGRMDAAVDRTLAGAATFNPGEFKSGVGEIWQAMKQQPLKDPVREQYAQCLELTDTSAADNNIDINPNAGGSCDFILTPEAKKPSEILKESRQQLGWRERLVQGEKPEIGANNPKGHAEREEMREALKHLQPPTNSIN